MTALSELLDRQGRGEDITPNANNNVTKKRRALGNKIFTSSGGDNEAAYNMSMDILGGHIERLQEFVLSHSEEPAPELNQLVAQVYQLRQQDINDAAEVLEFSDKEALIFTDQQEADFFEENGYNLENFLGELAAPIDIAYAHISKSPDNFIDPALVSGVINAVGTKVNAATLVRAAKGKKSGILGAMSTGGKKKYTALVEYFKKNPAVAKQVISGQITSEDYLPGWAAIQQTQYGSGTGSLLGNIASDVERQKIKQYLPFIIGGVLLLIVIVYFAARSKK